MTLTFYDGLGHTAYCNCLPASTVTPPLLLAKLPPSLSVFLDIKNRSIILDAPPCRLPLR